MVGVVYSFDEAMQMIKHGLSGFVFRNAQGKFAQVTFDTVWQNIRIDELESSLSFGSALASLKAGKRVARAGWNGKNMFLFLVDGTKDLKVNREPLISILGEGAKFTYQPHVDMFTADGTIVPWLCSQTDMLADDWCIVPNA
jgi:hypothetical protein